MSADTPDDRAKVVQGDPWTASHALLQSDGVTALDVSTWTFEGYVRLDSETIESGVVSFDDDGTDGLVNVDFTEEQTALFLPGMLYVLRRTSSPEQTIARVLIHAQGR